MRELEKSKRCFLRLKQRVKIQGLPAVNTPFLVGQSEENEIFFLFDKGDRYVLTFYTEEFQEKSKLVFMKGKGPAEILQPVNLRVVDNSIYISDLGSRKFLIFNRNGEFEEEFLWNIADTIITFAVRPPFLYFSEILKYKKGLYDMVGKKFIPIEKYDTTLVKFDKKILHGTVWGKSFNKEKLVYISYGKEMQILFCDIRFKTVKELVRLNAPF